MSERIEVGDVVLYEDRQCVVTHTMEIDIGQGTIKSIQIDGRWVSTSVVKLFAKKEPQVFNIGDKFTHTCGYDGEVFGLPVIVDTGIPGGAYVNDVILGRLKRFVADLVRTGFLPDYIRVIFDPPNYPTLQYVVVGYRKDGQ